MSVMALLRGVLAEMPKCPEYNRHSAEVLRHHPWCTTLYGYCRDCGIWISQRTGLKITRCTDRECQRMMPVIILLKPTDIAVNNN